MTSGERNGKGRAFRVGAAVVGGGLILGWLAGAGGCARDGAEPVEAAEDGAGAGVEAVEVTSRDGILGVTLPGGLVTHRFETAVQGMADGAGWRVHVEHGPEEEPLKASAVLKDVLGTRGWRISGERHFERATEVRMDRGGPPAQPEEIRVVYLVSRGGRLVTCDGTATAAAAPEALGESFRAICQAVTVRVPDAAPTQPADTDARSGPQP